MNRVELAGYIGKDPETKVVNGTTLSTFPIATNYQYTVNGEKKKITEWHKVVAWGWVGDLVAEQFRKGSNVFVVGRLTNRHYQTQHGDERRVTEVVAMDAWLLAPTAASRENEQQPPKDHGRDDEIPF